MSRAAAIGRLPATIAGRLGLVRWYNGREPRERLLILVGGAVVLAYVALFGLYRPLAAMRVEALADIATYDALTARVLAHGPDATPASEPRTSAASAGAITDSAVSVGLVIRRLEPEGGRTSIEIEDADFAVLIDWLALLEARHGLRVATIELDRRPAPGVVTARIAVEN